MINNQITKKIFNDENISRDERYMLLLFVTINIEEGHIIKITLNSLMEYFNCKRKIRVLNVLNSLAIKGYIEVIKTKGKSNSYKIIKDYLIIENLTSSSNENDTSSGDENDTSNKNVTGSGNGNDTGRGNENDTSNGNVTSRGNENDTSSGDGNDTSNGNDTTKGDNSVNKYNNINNNNLNNNLNNNNSYKQIVDSWNEENISNEDSINIKVTDAINNALKRYTVPEITKAIDNYSKVYKSSYYYNYKWTLVNFLNRPKGIPRFLDSGDIWLEYKSKHYSKYDEMQELGIDIQSYID